MLPCYAPHVTFLSTVSIGVSLLKAGIERRGFSPRVEYFSLPLAELIGYDLYEYIFNTLGSDSMAGEWFFADVVVGDKIPHERAFDEIKFLSETYGRKRIDCVDNILDMKYVNTLFPRLRDSGLGIGLFYEVKSNLLQTRRP